MTAGKLFVGIDPSITNTGVVILNEQGDLVKYVDKLKPKETGIPGYAIQAKRIIEEIGNPCCVVYEDYSYASIHKAYSLAEYGGILKFHLLQLVKPEDFYLVAPTQVKLFATGNGSAGKTEVAREMKLCFPSLPSGTSSDITDAAALALMCFFINKRSEIEESHECYTKFLRQRLEVANNVKKRKSNYSLGNH